MELKEVMDAVEMLTLLYSFFSWIDYAMAIWKLCLVHVEWDWPTSLQEGFDYATCMNCPRFVGPSPPLSLSLSLLSTSIHGHMHARAYWWPIKRTSPPPSQYGQENFPQVLEFVALIKLREMSLFTDEGTILPQCMVCEAVVVHSPSRASNLTSLLWAQLT